MKKWVKRFLKYIRNPANEFGFIALTVGKKRSALPVNICIDDNGSWINLGNKKIILFQTNYDNHIDFNKMLPMTVENNPHVLGKKEKLDLKNSEIDQIKYFVIQYQEQLLQISNGEIEPAELFKIITDNDFYRKTTWG
jgi:hypothetical protein